MHGSRADFWMQLLRDRFISIFAIVKVAMIIICTFALGGREGRGRIMNVTPGTLCQRITATLAFVYLCIGICVFVQNPLVEREGVVGVNWSGSDTSQS